MGSGETLILIIDPYCPGFDDDVVVADFTLPYRASCCEADNKLDEAPLPYQRDDGSLVVEIRDSEDFVLGGASVYLLSDGQIKSIMQTEERVDPTRPETWQTTFDMLSPSESFEVFGLLVSEQDTFYFRGVEKGLHPTVDGAVEVVRLEKRDQSRTDKRETGI